MGDDVGRTDQGQGLCLASFLPVGSSIKYDIMRSNPPTRVIERQKQKQKTNTPKIMGKNCFSHVFWYLIGSS